MHLSSQNLPDDASNKTLILRRVLRHQLLRKPQQPLTRFLVSQKGPFKILMKQKKIKHIHDDPRIDCLACVEWIKAPLPRVRMPSPVVTPAPQSPLEKRQAKLMQKMIDYEYV